MTYTKKQTCNQFFSFRSNEIAFRTLNIGIKPIPFFYGYGKKRVFEIFMIIAILKNVFYI